MGRVHKSPCCAVRCDTHNSDISITEQTIKINIFIYLYTNEDITWDEYTYMFIQYYSNIYINKEEYLQYIILYS